MLPALLLILQAATAVADKDKDIVVTARSLDSTKATLDACLARHCPPAEDIEVSLAHAENQFLAGEYQQARITMLAARSRNRRFAPEIPTEVADLLRANGRIASLNGHVDEGRLGQIEAVEALKAGLPHDDRRVLLQRLEIGNAFIKRQRYRAASDVYSRVAKQAHRAGLPAVEGAALLRRAMLYSALAEVRSEYDLAADHAMRDLTSTTDPQLQPFRDAVVLLRAETAGRKGDVSAVDAIAATYKGKPAKEPVLLYQPTLLLQQAPDPKSGVVRLTGSSEPAWADYSFSIGPSGRVQEVSILRQSGAARSWWVDQVRENIAARRYAPIQVPANQDGVQRIERFSLVFDLLGPSTGSRLVTRASTGRLESIDLTADVPRRDLAGG